MITSANIQVLFEYMNHTILKNEIRTFFVFLSSLVFIGNHTIKYDIKKMHKIRFFGCEVSKIIYSFALNSTK
ncbi:hypothetical protein C5O23_04055 [Duncaniella muris]|uniref:Uncharacterized protein n=1 Tax=Duncaniella muris TaxID=2094150 RepID=A0A2V1IL20_9BACT|nr:hypothetical protein C5O23_04055 [Duncaniella muris]